MHRSAGVKSSLPRRLALGAAAIVPVGSQRVQSGRDGGRRQYHGSCRDRYHRDRRPVAFRHRHHGHLRDRGHPGRAAGHRADQRPGRGARAAGQDHPGRRRLRLADLRRKGQKLLEADKVAAVFGCWTSASRKAVLPIFEKDNGLLYYPTFYEGLEQSKNVFYTGQEATQQILSALDWLARRRAPRPSTWWARTTSGRGPR